MNINKVINIDKNMWKISLLLLSFFYVSLINQKYNLKLTLNTFIIVIFLQIIIIFSILFMSVPLYNKVIKINEGHKIFLLAMFPSAIILGILSIFLFAKIQLESIGQINTFLLLIRFSLILGLIIPTYLFHKIKNLSVGRSFLLSLVSFIFVSIICLFLANVIQLSIYEVLK